MYVVWQVGGHQRFTRTWYRHLYYSLSSTLQRTETTPHFWYPPFWYPPLWYPPLWYPSLWYPSLWYPSLWYPHFGTRHFGTRHFGTQPRDYVLTSPPDSKKSDVYHVVTVAALAEMRSHAAWTATDTLFSIISSTSVPVFDSQHGQRSFSFSVESRSALRAHPPPIHIDRDAYPTVKWPKCEADHLPLSTAKAKNSWN